MDGDDLGAAKACAHRFRHTVTPQGENLFRALQSFVSGPRLVLGICNGFQLLVKLGLIPAVGGVQIPQATVWANDSGRFEDRWVHLAVDPDSPCVFTRGLVGLELPVRHGEGKVIFANPQVGAQVVETNAVPLRYVDPQSGLPTETYPHNPNGSKLGIAALCDETGRIFGLMPHPEAFVERTHHPQWTRRELDTEGAGLALFRNAVRWLRRNGP
jgi:phosphoribosylformylglycinamidine synthase